MRRPRFGQMLLSAACLASMTSALGLRGYIFERDSTCAAGANFTQCSGSGLPSDFCCPSSSTCEVLAGNTTILCCPSGQNCATIKPITCDLQQQNATLHPESGLKTTALSGSLQFCGLSCCPFGYSCNGDGNCVQDSDQSKAPATSSSASSSPTSSASASPSSSAAQNTTITDASSKSGGSKFPTGPVVGGIFGGLAFGIGVTILLIWYCGVRKRKAAAAAARPRPQSMISGSSFGMISDPQPLQQIRTDFLRKAPETPSSGTTVASQRRNTIGRVKSLFRKSTASQASTPSFGGESPRDAPPIPMIQRTSPQELPVTPPRQREPSFVDIDIFADNDTASALRERERHGYTHNTGLGIGRSDSGRESEDGRDKYRDTATTTFSDMMEQTGLAGLERGQREFRSSYPTPPSEWV